MGGIGLANIEDGTIRKEFLQRTLHEHLKRLDFKKSPKWGQFNPQQMVEHLIWAFDISIGKVVVPCTTPRDKIDVFKRFLYSNTPTRPNFKNPILEDLPIAPLLADLQKAKTVLKEKTLQFYGHYKQPEQKEIHPIFGPLNFEEWERNHFKHCIHHLTQFGLI